MRALVAGCLLTLVSVVPRAQQSENLIDRFVLTQKDAYFVAPPRLIADGNVLAVQFSRKGDIALVYGIRPEKVSLKSIFEPAPPNHQEFLSKMFLKIWTLSTDGLRDASPAIASLMSLNESIFSLQWSTQPGVALLQDTIEAGEDGSYTTQVKRVNFNDGTVTVQQSFKVASGESVIMHLSPTQPRYVVVRQSRNNPIDKADIKSTISFTAYDLQGREVKSGGGTVNGRAHVVDWTANGQDLVGMTVRRPNPAAKAQTTTIVLNLTTGVLSETSEKISVYEVEEELPLEGIVAKSLTQLKNEKKEANSLWLSSTTDSKDSQCLVATGVGEECWLSPTMTQIAYVSQGRLFSCEIAKVDLKTYLTAKEAADRNAAMNRAKQVATAAMIYAADYDDAMPLQAGFEESIYPYIKNRDTLNGFVYTFGGGLLTKVEKPAETEMGYINVNGGRIVAYVDGHVKFIKNP